MRAPEWTFDVHRHDLGRGSDKISPADAAAAVITGIGRDSDEIRRGKVRLLRTLVRLSPRLAHRILRNS